MKSNKGITLISLMIYLIVLSIVIGSVATFTRYFYRNTNETIFTMSSSQKFVRVTEFISEDVNSGNIERSTISNDKIIFYMNNGDVHEYINMENMIYYVAWDKDGNEIAEIKLSNEIDSFEIKQVSTTPVKIMINAVISSVQYNSVFIIK